MKLIVGVCLCWFHLVHPPIHAFVCGCCVSIFHDTCQSHCIFAHLMNQLRKVYGVLVSFNSKIWIFCWIFYFKLLGPLYDLDLWAMMILTCDPTHDLDLGLCIFFLSMGYILDYFLVSLICFNGICLYALAVILAKYVSNYITCCDRWMNCSPRATTTGGSQISQPWRCAVMHHQ